MKMKENDPFFSFSLWIRSKMLEDYNKGQTNLAAFERLVPPDFICTNCGMRGSHWSPQCPNIQTGNGTVAQRLRELGEEE